MENTTNKMTEKKDSENNILKYEGMNLTELRNALMKEYDKCCTILNSYSKEIGLISQEARLLMVEDCLISFDDVTRVYISEETEYSGDYASTKSVYSVTAQNGKIEYDERSCGPAYDYDDVSYWLFVSIDYVKNGEKREWNESLEPSSNEFGKLATYVAYRECGNSQDVEIIRIRDGIVDKKIEKRQSSH